MILFVLFIFIVKIEDLEEIKSGRQLAYKVIVKTSDRPGSSTEADVKLQMYGKKGKSKMFTLKNSTTHRIPFRRSNIDIFELNVYDIGNIKAISIGHSETEIGLNFIFFSISFEYCIC